MNQRLLLILLLGFSSGLPLSLITSTLQAWFAHSGMSVLATGSLSLIGLPYIYRMFWAPILDRISFGTLGKRRSWILLMQFLLFIGFETMAVFAPDNHAGVLASLALLMAVFSATQDIAIDAHRTEYLHANEYGLGASLAVFGYRIALLISGGLALVMAQHYGWMLTYRAMGLLLLPPMLGILLSKEPKHPQSANIPWMQSFIGPVRELWQRPGILALLLFIFFFKVGEAFTTTISGIVMPFLIQGLGFSIETIGYVNKVLGISAVLIGGLVGGLVLLRCSLYSALMAFGLIQALTNALFIVLAMVGPHLGWLCVAVVADNFACGMGSTALVALLMLLVDKRFTATQLSILIAFSTIPRVFSGPFAALVQMQIGWVGLYQLSTVLALFYIPFLRQIRGMISPHKGVEPCVGYSC
jgi:PAT family beta-lactamase induction signal transducer AmpG